MIPVADNIPIRKQPIVNYLLIGCNIIAFLWELKLAVDEQLRSFIYSWGIVPIKISSVISDALISKNPAAWIALILSCISLLTGIFLHGSFGQILGNTIFLSVFGKSVENKLGHGLYLIFYLICGILISIVQVSIDPQLTVPLIGANGAIASILGAYIFLFPKAKIETILPLVVVFIPIELPAVFYLFWWFVQQGFYGIGTLDIGGVNPVAIAYWGHGIGIALGISLIRVSRLFPH